MRNTETGLRPFITEWRTVLENIPDRPADKYLESLFRKEIEKSAEIKDVYRVDLAVASREKPPRKLMYDDLMDMCLFYLAEQLKRKTEKQYDASTTIRLHRRTQPQTQHQGSENHMELVGIGASTENAIRRMTIARTRMMKQTD